MIASSVTDDLDFLPLDPEIGLREPAFGTLLRRSDLYVGALVLLGSCAAIVLVATGDVVVDPSAFAAMLVANIATLAVAGLLWRHGRPTSGFGYLLLAEAAVVALSALVGSPVPAVHLVGLLGGWGTALGLTWLLLAFPGVGIPRGGARFVMGVALASFVLGELPELLVSRTVLPLPSVGSCVGACPTNPAVITVAPSLAHGFGYAESALEALWGVGLLVYLILQLDAASYPRRRLLAPVFVTSAPFIAAFTGFALFTGLAGLHWGVGAHALFVSTRILLPLGFMAALLFGRVYAGEALTVMARRLGGRPPVAAVEALVRRVLDDPQAQLVFWLPFREYFVDRRGTRALLEQGDEGKTWHAFGHGDTPVLAIVHDSVLSDDPELLDAVGATALLTLENRRLEQDLLDSVDALRSSQRRLVAAASAERRKIERDLHDGVQQKLIAVRIQLELALEDGGAKEDLAALGPAFDDALDELRSVAHGIYPPLLADEGLAVVLTDAARRSTVPLTVDVQPVGRLSEDREAAIYYCCLEALQNVAKHAGEDATASLRLWRSYNVVHFSVSDDGAGFDSRPGRHGAGLTNMADRMGAVGGSLHVTSTPGEGTTVEGRVTIEAADRTERHAAHA